MCAGTPCSAKAMLSLRWKNCWSSRRSAVIGRPAAAKVAPIVERSKPVSHARPGPPASESGRPIISISRFADMRAMGTTGCARYQRVPTSPTSSPVVVTKMTVRFGRGPAASARAISMTATVPEASSSAPL